MYGQTLLDKKKEIAEKEPPDIRGFFSNYQQLIFADFTFCIGK